MKILNPIWVKDSAAYFSLSDWNFQKYADKNGDMKVEVYREGIFRGQNIVNRKDWIKSAKENYDKVYYRPTQPIKFYLNIMKLKPEQTEEEKIKENCMLGIYG